MLLFHFFFTFSLFSLFHFFHISFAPADELLRTGRLGCARGSLLTTTEVVDGMLTSPLRPFNVSVGLLNDHVHSRILARVEKLGVMLTVQWRVLIQLNVFANEVHADARGIHTANETLHDIRRIRKLLDT